MTVFMLLRALPSWLALPRSERSRIALEATAPLSSPFRFFDAEAFSAVASDVVMFEAKDPLAYHFDVEKLRDSPLFATPYFEVVSIIPAIEDGFRQYENKDSSR